jgi:murein DD-endopeptidase MepM/ murein hydrolase activator NlpD
VASRQRNVSSSGGLVTSARAKRGTGAAVLVGFMVAAGVLPGSPAAGDLNDDKQQIDAAAEDAHSDVIVSNKQVAKATKQVVAVRKLLPAANAKVQYSLSAKAEAERQSEKATAALTAAKNEIRIAQAELDVIEQQINELRGNVGSFARRAYQMGPFAELELLLEAKDPADFTHRLEAIRVVSRSNGQALTTMVAGRADLDHVQIRLIALKKIAVEKTALVEAQLAVAQEAAAAAAAAQAHVAELLAKEKAALASTQAHRSEVKAQYDKLAAEQARIRAEIAEAARRAEAKLRRLAAEEAAREAARKAAGDSGGSSGDASGGSTGGGGSSSSGQWLFPVAGGAIGSNAGWRFHPILKYTRCHAGSDIGAGSGTPIRAVASGIVVSAGYNGGYGNFTTIAHGNGVTSSYAHQSSIGVSNGQTVSRGQTIGRVGSTGLSSGPHLHFEARVYGAPYNPRGWFGTGSKSPVCV